MQPECYSDSLLRREINTMKGRDIFSFGLVKNKHSVLGLHAIIEKGKQHSVDELVHKLALYLDKHLCYSPNTQHLHTYIIGHFPQILRDEIKIEHVCVAMDWCMPKQSKTSILRLPIQRYAQLAHTDISEQKLPLADFLFTANLHETP